MWPLDEGQMQRQPELTTARLVLRPYRMSDASEVQRLAGAKEIADGTHLPHPYPDGFAEEWIGRLPQRYDDGELVAFAITLAQNGSFVGSIGLGLDQANQRGQLGYWIGVPYWGKGYCTEAARAILRYGFEVLRLQRIWAPHFRDNPASGRVLQKIGMKHEGCQRAHIAHSGGFKDLELYGMLRSEFSEAT